MEVEFPGRRLDGLYCFMKAETDRHIGKYEDAMRNYEMIFKLPQWAGYRDRATFGIADSYGTLEPGKDADVVIWDGDPLDVTSAPTAVFVKGAQMPMTSRQTELRDRYRDLSKPPFGYH